MTIRGLLQGGNLLVLAYAALSQVEVHVWRPDAGVAPRLLLLAGVLVLLGRSRLPRASALLCALGGGAAQTLLGPDSGTGVGIVTAGIAAAMLGAQGKAGALGVALVAVMTGASTLVHSVQTSDLVTAPVLLLTIAGGSAGLSRARRRVAALRVAVERAEAEGSRAEATLLTAERRRVARELHDVASHHLTVAGLQASAARLQLPRDRAVAAQALAAAEQAGRAALGDLRPLLDLLGTEQEVQLAPQPGLAALPSLVQQVTAAGLDVRLELDDDVPTLPPGPDLVAFRVVQEALTNALRHGTGSASLHVAPCALRSGDGLRIAVENPVRRRNSQPDRTRAAHGLLGLRERVELYGGELQVSGREDAFTLLVLLPVPASVTVPA